MALGSEVNDNSTKNVSQKVKKQQTDTSAPKCNKSSGDHLKKGAANGHAERPLNGHAEDEGGGARPPSYAAAARRTLPPKTENNGINSDTSKGDSNISKPTNSLDNISKPTNSLETQQSNNVETKSSTEQKQPKNTPATPKDNEQKVCKQNNAKLNLINNLPNGDTKDSNGSHNIPKEKKEETNNNNNNDDNITNTKNALNGEVATEVIINGVNGDKSEVDDNGNSSKSDLSDKEDKGKTETDETSVNGESSSQDEEENKKDHVVFIQDIGFSIKIVSPGAEPLDIQVSSVELVQEIHQLLMDREDTCHRTCFSLQLDGVTLDNFAELKNIEGLKEGSVVKVVEEPYTVREARIHVRHVRDLLKSLDYTDAYAGTECNSLAFLNVVTQGDILEKKKTRPESVDCTPPDFIMPGNKDRPILPLHPGLSKDHKGPQCVKILTTSGWNPPPGPRKANGDLLYLQVVTMEDKHFHITSCPRGFYLNQSTDQVFNPKPAVPSFLCHSLIEILNIISPAFKRAFSTTQRKRTQKHPFERVATPYQVYQWISPVLDHTIDAIRAEDNFSSKLGYEEHIPGQTRDWNEELQTTRELSRKTLPERLLRERAIFKVHSDFVAAATRGAMAVVDGNVMAINPGEDPKMQMFIWNNIFFSLGFDVRDHYKDLGGDAAAFVAPRNDLQGVRVYSAVDLEGLYTLGTVVVDYRGYRVTAQSIIPGIMEKEQEQSVTYGSIDFGKTVLSHPKYMELLSKAGQQLKILPHSVESVKGDVVELCSSVECKGIIGNDGRYYILDLLRTFPPDVNFLKLEDDDLRDDVKAMGFPIIHKHKLCCLRQELVDSFVEARYFMFIRYAAYHLQQLSAKKHRETTVNGETQKSIEEAGKDQKDTKLKDSEKTSKPKKEEVTKEKEPTQEKTSSKLEEAVKDAAPLSDSVKIGKEMDIVLNEGDAEIDADEAKKIVESITDSIYSGDRQEIGENTRDIVRAAARMVGSLKDSEFDVRFNPDVYSAGIKHAAASEELARQRNLVKEAAAFLLTTQIPAFVRDCLEHTSAPMDGAALVDALHTRGINVRYLGKVADALAKLDQLSYLTAIAVTELLTRAAKHIFTGYVQATDQMSLASSISHFLNCLLGGAGAPAAPTGEEPAPARGAGRARRRHRNKGRGGATASDKAGGDDWQMLTPKGLFGQIKAELKAYWGYELVTESMEAVLEKHSLQKISILRSFCLKVGVQILLREYDFDNKTKATFNSSDIMNIFPVVKHINPRASDAYNFYTTGQSKIQSGNVTDGHELITEALNLLNNVYGAMHPEIAQCLRMVARLCYVTGDHRDAMAYQQKAVLMSERVNGVDHPYTITEYTHLALYCFANSQVSTALKLLYRARYLALVVCGENHPEIALLDSNISLILHAVGEYELSLRFLERALALTSRYHGPRSLKAAVARHLLARTLSCLGDFRAALAHEKETYSIYKLQLGEQHEKTRESSECLRHLTQQAVVLAKRLSDAAARPVAPAPPIHIQPPSMGSVLDMLNVINGILFVQISQQDIEQFKAEIEKRQLKDLPIPESDSKSKSAIANGESKAEPKEPVTKAEPEAPPKQDKKSMAVQNPAR